MKVTCRTRGHTCHISYFIASYSYSANIDWLESCDGCSCTYVRMPLKTRRSSVLYRRQMQHLSSSGSNRPLFTFTRKYLRIENTLTVEWRNIVGGMQYRLTLCYGMHHHLLLFTAYWSWSKSGCPAPSSTENSEKPSTQNFSIESLHQRIPGTFSSEGFQETQWLRLATFISSGCFDLPIESCCVCWENFYGHM